MRYDVSKATAPAMPNLGKGTEIVKLLLTQASKDMYEPLVPMFFPIFGAHICGAEFQYPDFSWKEPCGMMANLVAKSGDNKGQLTTLAKAICRDFSLHDEAEEKKILEWQKQKQTEPDNKKKTARPDVFFRFPPSNTTNAAFIQNAMALEAQGGLTQYFNLPEVEMADRLCGGHKAIAIPSATLLTKKDVEILKSLTMNHETLTVHMFPDRDAPGERLFLQLQKVLPSLVHHQLPPDCKDFSDYYLKLKVK